MPLKKYIPAKLKYPLIALYVLGRVISRGLPSRDLKLNLAGVLPPPYSNKIIHGGKVKLIYLRERFGDSWKRFDIAYFVSSGLPFAPSIWTTIYKMFGVKIVWNQNGVAYGAWTKDVEKINSLMKPIHDADYVIYQTEFVKKCADQFLGKIRKPSSIVYNPVDTNLFKPGVMPKTLTLLAIGSHFNRERIIIPIQVLRKLHEKGVKAKLIIAGRLLWANAEEDVRKESEGLEEFIEREGPFLQRNAPQIYQKASILIHLKYLDPCPTVVLEALSSGVPVIGSASGGLPEMVSEKAGVLIPIEEGFDVLRYPTVDEVVEAVMKIKSKMKQYSKGAREYAQVKFNKEDWIKKHEQIFQNVCR